MKKHFSAILCSFVLICWATGASAALTTIHYAFTADNQAVGSDGIIGFSLLGPDDVSVYNFGDKSTHWTTAMKGSQSIELQQGATYTLQWLVQNERLAQPTAPGDPMAFIGQFALNTGAWNLSSATSGVWGVSSSGGGALTAYDTLRNAGTWAAGYNSLSGIILTSAQWIGAGLFPGDSPSMIITAKFTAPVPIPGAALLLGSAILGLVGIRRRQLV